MTMVNVDTAQAVGANYIDALERENARLKRELELSNEVIVSMTDALNAALERRGI